MLSCLLSRWIAFLRYQPDGRAAIVRIPSIGGREKVVTEVDAPSMSLSNILQWSHDGHWLITLDRDGSAVLVAGVCGPHPAR